MQDGDGGNPVRVLLADDHTMFREGLAKVLAAYGGIEVVAQTANDDRVVALAREEKPNVVVMQVQVPFERAKATLDEIRWISPAPKVVICTMFEDPRYVREFLKLGVSAYLRLNPDDDEMKEAWETFTGRPATVERCARNGFLLVEPVDGGCAVRCVICGTVGPVRNTDEAARRALLVLGARNSG
jgi:DNA-binding NarL/FixJ family response regulator